MKIPFIDRAIKWMGMEQQVSWPKSAVFLYVLISAYFLIISMITPVSTVQLWLDGYAFSLISIINGIVIFGCSFTFFLFFARLTQIIIQLAKKQGWKNPPTKP